VLRRVCFAFCLARVETNGVGITGQAIVFAVYERVRKVIETVRETNLTDTYSE
jgi:hypothetical protein